MTISLKTINALESAIDRKIEKAAAKRTRTQGVVSRTGNDGTVYAVLQGSDMETPMSGVSASVKPGDVVNVTVQGGKAYIDGNYTDPSAGVVMVQRVESTATDAIDTAIRASQAADFAEAEAVRAGVAADSAQEAATTAWNHADDAYTAAQSAQSSATWANTYANSALTQLGIVEDVIGTVNWITKHGTYELSSDTTVDPDKVYYTRTGSDTTQDPYIYTPVANPEGNPSTSGYYELNIDSALSQYVASHLALTDEGLYVVKDNQGYKLLLSNNGMVLSDSTGTPVATYGQTATLGVAGSSQFKVNANGLQAYDSSGDLYFQVSSNGLEWGDGITPITTDDVSLSEIVVSTVIEYAVGTSSSTAPSSGWSTNTPTWEAGKYVWMRTTVTYADDTVSSPHKTVTTVCIQGADGAPGTAVNSAAVRLYKRGSTAPAKPNGDVTYMFSTGTVSGSLNGWTLAIPSGTDPCWAIAASASSTGTSDTIAYTEWSDAVKVLENGTNGGDGLNQATIYLYQRSASSPSLPSSSVTYTFATGLLDTVPSGWSRTIPTTNGNPCWVTSAVAISAEATDTIGKNEWVTPTKMAEDGVDSYSYELSVSPSAVVRAEGGTLTPSSITLSATRAQGTGTPSAYSGRFKVDYSTDGSSWTNVYTTSSATGNESSRTVNVPTTSGVTLLRCTLYLAGGTTTQLDQQTVPILDDGSSAYTVMLTNESHTFPAGTSAAVNNSTATTTVVAYKGATSVTPTIGTITTGVTDLTASKNGTTITFTASSSLTTKSGTVDIPVTVDGITFTKKFSWSLALTGQPGSDGGRWYTGTGITGTSTTPTVFSGSGVTTAVVGDMYLNTSTYNTYRCTLGGNASTAKWAYAANIEGEAGLNQATVMLFNRASSATRPSNGSATYTFSTGVLSMPAGWTSAGWSQTFPPETQGNSTPVWIMIATASSSESDATLSYTAFSTPVKMVSSGTNGADGKMLYATCSTSAGTQAKAAYLTPTDADLTLYTGLTVTVQFTNANSHYTPTLNLYKTASSGLGAKAIHINGAAASSTNPAYWRAGAAVVFVYDGTQWKIADNGALTDAANAALTATNYIREDSTGIRIANADPDTASTYQHQTSTYTEFVVDNVSMAEFGGSGARIGSSDSAHIMLGQDSMAMVQPDNVMALDIESASSSSQVTKVEYPEFPDTKLESNETGSVSLESLSTLSSGTDFTLTIMLEADYSTSIYWNRKNIDISFTKGTSETETYSIIDTSFYYDGDDGLTITNNDTRFIYYNVWRLEYLGTAYAPAFTFGTRDSTSEIGSYSFSSGKGNEASEAYSHAEGIEAKASGTASHAEGRSTVASGNYSHAEGGSDFSTKTTASGSYSHAEGYACTASEFAAHAEGSRTEASGWYSHASGNYTIAAKTAQVALGSFNVEDTSSTTTHPCGNSHSEGYGKYAVIVGNGELDGNGHPVRSNALTVDWNGNVECGAVNDSGWQTLLMTSSWKPYNNVNANAPRYRKVNGMVEVRGAISPTSSTTLNTTVQNISSSALPSEYRPSGYDVDVICQASDMKIWLLSITTNGNVQASRLRNMGSTSYQSAGTSEWLVFQASYFAG